MTRTRRRSWLFVPANKARWAEPALASGADCLIVDFEDSVAKDAKDAGRAGGLELVAQLIDAGGPEVFVRINGLSTPFWLDDVAAIAAAAKRPVGVVVPEIKTAREITTLDDVITALSRKIDPTGEQEPLEIHPIFESPQAIVEADAILRASPRIQSYFGGAAPDADLASLTGFLWTAGRLETLYIRSRLLLAGRAAGIALPIGGTWLDVKDLDGLASYIDETKSLGFAGMYSIHPSHIAAINAAFSPTADQVEWAEKVIAALRSAQADGGAAGMVDGRMVDEATRLRATKYLSGG